MNAVRLDGLRVFVVEDEFLLGHALEQDLQGAGCSVLGPFRRLAHARQAAQEAAFDVALLDINLAGDLVYPLADDLMARGKPFLFLSGYSAADLPARFRSVPRLSKPCDMALLLRELGEIAKG